MRHCKIAVLADSIQESKSKTKFNAVIERAEELKELKSNEEKAIQDKADRIKKSGCNVVVCGGKYDACGNLTMCKQHSGIRQILAECSLHIVRFLPHLIVELTNW